MKRYHRGLTSVVSGRAVCRSGEFPFVLRSVSVVEGLCGNGELVSDKISSILRLERLCNHHYVNIKIREIL